MMVPAVGNMNFCAIQFDGSIADAHSEWVKRARDHGPEIFDPFQDEINSIFAALKKCGDPPLTYTKHWQVPLPLKSFSAALFLSESAGAHRLLPGLDSIIGVWERSPGVFESNPINARLMYKNYKVKGGEEFENEVLFRVRVRGLNYIVLFSGFL
jgi:hypothetical protein